MGSWKKNSKAFILVLTWLGTAACTEVQFAPANLSVIQQGPIDEGNKRTESFFFNEDRPPSKVDVLFVVDNSGSMQDEQQKLSTALSSFVDSLSGLDWQVAITTTDISGGKYSTNGQIVTMEGLSTKVLSQKIPNYEQVFLDTVLAHGTPANCVNDPKDCASGDEQPLEATRLAVGLRNSDNYGFFRANSDFISITLSDEDEMSRGGGGATTPETLISTVNSAWGLTKLFSGYGIIIRPTDTSCLNDQTATGGRVGSFVQRLADLTNAVTGSICDQDYGPALATIGQRVRKFATSVSLSDVPIPGSVQVILTPSHPNITWIVVGQTVRLSDLPTKGTRVDITYERSTGP